MSEHYTDEDAMAGAAALWADRGEEDDFASLAPSFQSLYVGDARAVLDAVAPAIAARAKAEALHEAEQQFRAMMRAGYGAELVSGIEACADYCADWAFVLGAPKPSARADEIEGR